VVSISARRYINRKEIVNKTPASSAIDTLDQRYVAIKRIRNTFSTKEAARRAYREIRLLKDLRHDNVCEAQHVKHGSCIPANRYIGHYHDRCFHLALRGYVGRLPHQGYETFIN
jgi:serine/threonine protein kinase